MEEERTTKTKLHGIDDCQVEGANCGRALAIVYTSYREEPFTI